MTEQARAAYEARYQCDANDPMNANDLALFVAGYEAAASTNAPLYDPRDVAFGAVAVHETQSTLHNAACDVPAVALLLKHAETFRVAAKYPGEGGQGMMHASWLQMVVDAIDAIAAAPAQPAAGLVGLTEQHDRDSAELRRLCQARDDARRERDLARVEAAGLEASVGNLGRLVDELRPDAERLEWVLRRVSGSWLRAYVGHVGDTGNMDTLRTLIDANRGALESETAHPKEQTP